MLSYGTVTMISSCCAWVISTRVIRLLFITISGACKTRFNLIQQFMTQYNIFKQAILNIVIYVRIYVVFSLCEGEVFLFTSIMIMHKVSIYKWVYSVIFCGIMFIKLSVINVSMYSRSLIDGLRLRVYKFEPDACKSEGWLSPIFCNRTCNCWCVGIQCISKWPGS